MTKEDKMTATEIVDELTYRNYRFNRLRSPGVTPERWAQVYPHADALEARYQREHTDAQRVQSDAR